jgi:triacylglycerol lipase
MIAGIGAEKPGVARSFVGLGGVAWDQICLVGGEVGDETDRVSRYSAQPVREEPFPDVGPGQPAARPALTPVPPPLPAHAPRWWGHHFRELRWQAEFARLLVDPVYQGVGVPRATGASVMLLPGFLAGDASLAVMGDWLRRIGYVPVASGMQANVGCSDRAVDRLEGRLEREFTRSGRPVALVGHSRGAHFAKALAHRCPDKVAAVVSLGAGLDAPYDISLPTQWTLAAFRTLHAHTSDRIARNGCLTATCRCRFTRDYAGDFPARVPLTSIYSKGDGVVRWPACVVAYARCVEVSGSHVGLAFNRKVYRVLAETLAEQTAVR